MMTTIETGSDLILAVFIDTTATPPGTTVYFAHTPAPESENDEDDEGLTGSPNESPIG